MNKLNSATFRSRLFRSVSLSVAVSLAANAVIPAALAGTVARIDRYADALRNAPLPEGSFKVADDAAPAPQSSPPVSSDKAAQENMFWESAQHSNTIADYKAYLDAFPNGLYAPLAKNRIAVLSAAPQQGSPQANQMQPAPANVPSSFGPTPPAVSPDALKGEVGTVDTENSLNMGPQQRMELQQRLSALGLYNGPINGDLGPAVRTAIAEWQKHHSAAPTGEIGPIQLAALRAESEEPFQHLMSSAPPMQPPMAAQMPPAGPPSAFGPPPAPVSPEALKGEVGTVETENALNMGPPQRMELQQRLSALGLYNGPIDGDIGPGVRAAIAEWQKRHNVAPTGELGPLQLSALRVESEAPFLQLLAAPRPAPVVVAPRPVYYAPVPHHVVHTEAQTNYAAPVIGVLGGLALGLLGAKLGGKFGGGKGGGGKGGGKGGGHEKRK
jgi:peptidoglycan hydrolase-like protein with peptidoglycan-binding domain